MFIDRFVDPVLSLPRVVKRLIALGIDAGLCVLTVWIAFCLRLGEWVPLSQGGWPAALASLMIALPIFVVSGFYRAVFRHIGSEALTVIVQAVVAYGIIYASLFTAFGFSEVPRTVGIIQPALLLITIGASRGFARYWLGRRYRRRLRGTNRRNVLVYGAGSAGQQLAAAIADTSEMRLVGFVDDNRGLQGSEVSGLKVWGPERLPQTAEKLEVEEIFLAIPSASRNRRNEILTLVREANLAVRTLPGLLDLARGRVTVNDLRPLEIEDLLGRTAVPPDPAMIEKNIRDKVVLVTGAGGSIGSELCRQILSNKPAKLLLVESSEYALYWIHSELVRLAPELADRLMPLLGSVCDESRLRTIFQRWRPQTIYHAAAYKHVPLVEHNVLEGVRNNVIGTATCAFLAREFEAENFVLISTDKAVRPTNVMGASKRAAELVLQGLADDKSASCFAMVRFGNVLGSSGSVVPLFRQQILAGGPVTVTHREVIRYFMTIPEAAQLVLQAGGMGSGGEVFVLDMGEPVSIYYLARRMVELSGLRVRDDQHPDGDIEIVFSGLRPGEKLYEELLIGDDPVATSHPRIMQARESHLPLTLVETRLDELRGLIGQQDSAGVRDWLRMMVPEYVPSSEIVDWVYRSDRKGKGAAESEKRAS